MKGISDIIAMLLMLVITIAIAGLAYGFISGVFFSTTQGIAISDSYCSGGSVTLRIKNIGSTQISANSISITQTAPTGDNASPNTCCANPIDPGKEVEYTDSCTGTGPRNCVYRLTPPAGRTIEVSVSCI